MSRPILMSLFDETERRPLTVSELTSQVRGALESRFGSVWVEGEISNFRQAASGHWYFNVRDEAAQLRATCFRGVNSRIRFRPSDGLLVRVRGRMTVYEPRGEYELVVEALDPVGAGALRVAFEQLKERLAAEGLFDEALKRELPVLPRRIGVVTSPTGAAVRDIIRTIERRTRTVSVLVAPARVQGEGAGAEVARAIRLLNEHHRRALEEGREGDRVDAIIVGRGGGSSEDLWAFNEEEVARAIRASAIPVISAVGHETDFTISDFTADLRAPTPSAAAELVAAKEDEICATLSELGRNLSRLMRFRISAARNRVQQQALSQAFDEVRGRLRAAHRESSAATHRLHLLMTHALRETQGRSERIAFQLSPERLQSRLRQAKMRFNSAQSDCNAAFLSRLETARARLGLVAASLDALSPLAVLQRGYAIAEDAEGRLLRDAKSVSPGDQLRVRLAKGRVTARVEDTQTNDE